MPSLISTRGYTVTCTVSGRDHPPPVHQLVTAPRTHAIYETYQIRHYEARTQKYTYPYLYLL